MEKLASPMTASSFWQRFATSSIIISGTILKNNRIKVPQFIKA
jgi:hypothetical protein